MQIDHLTADSVQAGRGSGICGACSTNICPTAIDNLGVGHTHEHMESGRPELLEVVGFSLFDEGVQKMSTVQRVGLEPFLSIGLSYGSRMYDHPKSSGHEIPDDSLTGQRRQR